MQDLTLTPEQLALEDSLQRFLARDYDFARHQSAARGPLALDAAAWRQFAELGLLALPFPAEEDGLGGSHVDLYVVGRALGPGLVLLPYLETVVLCGHLLQRHASAAQRAALLPGLMAGERVLALAHAEPQSRHPSPLPLSTAQADGGGWRLAGRKAMVLQGPLAQAFLVSARSGDEADAVSLFLVPADTPGLRLVHYRNHDGTPASDLALDDAFLPGEALLGSAHTAAPALRHAVAAANAYLLAEAAGIARSLLADTAAYLQTRRQFGVPLSSFQALQHRLADMAVAVEQADAMAWFAASQLDAAEADDALPQVSGAKALVCEKARSVGQEAIQLHGGIGVTDELRAAHAFKRLTVIGHLFGDADFHLQAYGARL